MSHTIFSREYSGDELCDMERDVSEALFVDTNPRAEVITTNDDGFPQGNFTVTITWDEE